MIFVTVGAQMGFDRLIRAVDQWVGLNGCQDVFAQIGPGRYRPVYLRHERFLEPQRFRAIFHEASLIVAHAGMGSIITALEMAKPILVMPRRGDLGETRNDHQVATARRFADLGAVHLAIDEKELTIQLDRLLGQVPPQVSGCLGSRSRNGSCLHREYGQVVGCSSPCSRLLAGIRAFVHGMPVHRLLVEHCVRPNAQQPRPEESAVGC
ncbi:MAG TPA: glycosyltransferase [Phycisphaerae bacterium]|jgi:UDP-N-acetylglucosamine transferase subunit ALG13|nr:hypothetical protein [Phycisphaerae bacterium]HOB75138.1 glycosyltransferase [Phycisphaerae bacterium]HOJ54640.1 glycosyltransferase [Phycisphaerae bacterium]HOL27266.1 glycosyltransferase [Phycisphaerae bacterium]HPP21066.1 glycosyltransferase [Phycisphaerae bacterium]